MRNVTLCFLMKGNKICLAEKKRGFGAGKYNGIGGKQESDETVMQALVREVKEEVCVDIYPTNAELVADITFFFEEKSEWNQRMYVYIVKKFSGTPLETDEMRPEWFIYAKIPYEKMWIDDKSGFRWC